MEVLEHRLAALAESYFPPTPDITAAVLSRPLAASVSDAFDSTKAGVRRGTGLHLRRRGTVARGPICGQLPLPP